MMDEADDEQHALLSPRAREDLLRLLVQSGRRRIVSAVVDGRTVWIKRYDVEPQPLGKRLHALLSPLSPWPFLRSSPPARPEALVKRELRKMKAFREAGIPVAAVLHRGREVLVLTHVAAIVQDELRRLRENDAAAHDELLVGAAAALAHAHGLGLCHGRPHPRDMFVAEDGWGFVDFEEEPEATMPLRAAQARDVWLLFLQITDWALLDDTAERAFRAYAEAGPAGAVSELAGIVQVLTPLLPPLAHLDRVLGSDGRRVLRGTRALRELLAKCAVETASEAAGAGAGSAIIKGVEEA